MTDEEAEAPRPKRKKKRKKRVAEAGPPEESAASGAKPGRAPLDADGRERPQFLLAFPEDPELERLIGAFESGDFATVRRDAPALAERAEDPSVRDAALELRRRIDPDPLVRYLLIASVILLAVLVLHAYTHKL
jgi:hypothetical protein